MIHMNSYSYDSISNVSSTWRTQLDQSFLRLKMVNESDFILLTIPVSIFKDYS